MGIKKDKKTYLHISTFPYLHIPLFLLLTLPILVYADELEQTKQDLEASQARQAEIAEKQDKLEKELLYLQQRLVKSAGTTQKSETDQASAQEKLRILNEQINARSAELNKRRKNLAALVQAALHLSQMPPETLLSPNREENESTVKAASALKMTSASIRKEMQEITVQSEELTRLQKKTSAKQKDLSQTQEELDKEREELKEKLEQRKLLKEKLGARWEEEEKRVAELAKKAENLQGLIGGFNRKPPATGLGKKALRSFAGAKGKLRVPVAGKLIQGFGAAKHDETNRGIMLSASADDAQVVAPFDGQVVFAGTFLNYGKLVILKHSDDFHTLLAGLDSIDAGVGDFLLEGEPIGAMGNSEEGHRLYVELRKDNQPVNPEPWIKNLSKKR